MKTWQSLKSNHKIYDPVRKSYVKAFPEEIIRQKILRHMIFDLKYPKEWIAVEKDLSSILSDKNLSAEKRRVDILCFIKKADLFFPLLMIECKAYSLTKEAVYQVLGYNHHVQACYVAVANDEEIKTFWYDRAVNDYNHVNFLPSFEDLSKTVL